VCKRSTSTQLRATWHIDSLDVVVLPSTGASRYDSCCIDDGISPKYFLMYPRIICCEAGVIRFSVLLRQWQFPGADSPRDIIPSQLVLTNGSWRKFLLRFTRPICTGTEAALCWMTRVRHINRYVYHISVSSWAVDHVTKQPTNCTPVSLDMTMVSLYTTTTTVTVTATAIIVWILLFFCYRGKTWKRERSMDGVVLALETSYRKYGT
jgi:hypothetical protein